MPLFLTSFTPPPPVTGLEIEADLTTSAVRLTWAPTAVPEVDFGGYRVYRSTDNGITWVLLTLLQDVNGVTYEDFEAPLNTTLFYRVTQSNLDFESDPEEASTLLESKMWWVVSPDDQTLTFPIPKVNKATAVSPKVQDIFSPLGRKGKVAVGDVVQVESGEIGFLVMPDNPGMVNLLHRVQAHMDASLLLKAPDTSIFYVQVGDISRSFTMIEGLQELTLPFIGVS